MLRDIEAAGWSSRADLAFSVGLCARRPRHRRNPKRRRRIVPAPAPRRDLSGIWDVENRMEGISPTGVKSHAPFTAEGANIANNIYMPGDGPRRVPIGLVNDPLDSCDPAGFPRNLLFELRPFQVVQTSNQMLVLYQYQQVWRAIWTDGRELPKDPDPQWYGYSVGKWEDDYTFVAETFGMDERTWLDIAGYPHSSEMRVEERYHRVDRDTLELTVKIDDPKIYTATWLARDKLRLKLLPGKYKQHGNDLRAERGGAIQKDDGQSSFQVIFRNFRSVVFVGLICVCFPRARQSTSV